MGFVYVLRAMETDRYKIGLSIRDMGYRQKELNRKQSPFPIYRFLVFKTDNPKKLETEFHQTFSSYRKHGEWFEFKDSMLVNVMRKFDEVYTREHNPNQKLRGYISGVKSIKFTK